MHMSKQVSTINLLPNMVRNSQLMPLCTLSITLEGLECTCLEKGKAVSGSGMSKSAIHDQPTSQYGEQFTESEADYAIANL